jgi:lipopolysaccharide/colanic/teichoic acid biosynthesis glycosyltransferase
MDMLRHAESAGWAWAIAREALPADVLAEVERYGARETRAYLLAKRALDAAVAAAVLVLAAPVLALVCLALLAERNGPVFYQQERIGRYARPFRMYKLRTMRADRRARAAPFPFADRRRTLKAAHDPRVTWLGRLLRKSSLDEMPQLWNVLRGDMSLVGPRPEQAELLAHYRPEHYVRHCATPGLTGWWQINGRCRRGPDVGPEWDLAQKLADDRHYLECRSSLFDLRILLLTVPVVLGGRGAT